MIVLCATFSLPEQLFQEPGGAVSGSDKAAES
jgi:hypothetical protein